MGLGIFGPSIASGLVAGAPQLGAGGAAGTAIAGFGTLAVGSSSVVAGTRALAGGTMSALRAGTAVGSAASTAYRLGQATSGSPTVGAGLGGVASFAGHAARDRLSAATGFEAAARRGSGALMAGAGPSDSTDTAGTADNAPPWARRLRSDAAARHHHHLAMQALREGERGGAGVTPDIAEKED
jgi:type IV secretion system protein TrbL